MSFNYRSSSLPTKQNTSLHVSGDAHASETKPVNIMLQPSQVVPITLQARPPIHESGDHHVSEVFPNHDTTYASKATPSIKVVSF